MANAESPPAELNEPLIRLQITSDEPAQDATTCMTSLDTQSADGGSTSILNTSSGLGRFQATSRSLSVFTSSFELSSFYDISITLIQIE